MAITTYSNKGQKGAMMIPGSRLYLDRAGKKLVPAGDPEAYSLYCTKTSAVPRAEFERLGGPEAAGEKAERKAKSPAKKAAAKKDAAAEEAEAAESKE